MSNRINFLPPWVETNIQPAFYDKESGTCLQQTARMYAKVNQLVRSVNEQNETIADYIQKFIDLKDYCEDYFENLDVQNEINKKLDSMAQDGTLGAILAAYIQPTIDQLSNEVDSVSQSVDNLKRSYGTPLTASSVAGMTDTNKIYVNTSDGKWYYYDTANSEWTIGGTYQSAGIASGTIDISKLDTGLQESYLFIVPWEVGGIQQNGGYYYANNRCRFKRITYLRKGTTIKWSGVTSGRWFWQSWNSLNNADTYQNSGWLTDTEWVVPYDGYFSLGASYTDNRTVTDEDATIFKNSFSIYRTIPNYAGQPTTWFSDQTTKPFEISEYLTDGSVEVKLADGKAWFIAFENEYEFYANKYYTTARHCPLAQMSWNSNVENYGDISMGSTNVTFDLTIPNNYAFVIDVRSGELNVVYVGDLEIYHGILARAEQGRCTGALPYINSTYDLRDIKNNTERIDLVDSLAYYNTNVNSVNHRGYNTIAPENTLPAYQLSRKMGFTMVECDVQFTADDVAVLLHDATIDRTSNGTGNINDLTWEQVRQYDFGSWKSADYTGTRIPSFSEFIQLCKYLGLKPYVELKSDYDYTQAQINDLIDVVNRFGMKGNVTFISFSNTLLQKVIQTDQEVRIGYVVNNVTETVISNALALKTTKNEVFIDCSYGNLDNTGITLCRNANLPVEVWTIDNLNYVMNTLSPYVSGYTSNSLNVGKALYQYNIGS